MARRQDGVRERNIIHNEMDVYPSYQNYPKIPESTRCNKVSWGTLPLMTTTPPKQPSDTFVGAITGFTGTHPGYQAVTSAEDIAV